MKLKNLVFLPASPELRADLFKLGKDFILVKVEGKSQFMVVTNQLKLMLQLAEKHKIKEFLTSDSRRQTNIIELSTKEEFIVKELGLLKRTENPVDGNSFLIVTEDNATYHYNIE